MQSLAKLRQQVSKMAADQIGVPANQPYDRVSQSRYRGNLSNLFAMPVDPTDWQPLQNASTGLLVYMADFDGVDGGGVG